MDPRSRDLDRIRRTCTCRETRRVLVAVLKTGARYRITRKGVTIYGDAGMMATTHFTNSDHRAAKNFTLQLRRIGVQLPI